MFKFELDQPVYYLLDNKLHCAKIQGRKYTDVAAEGITQKWVNSIRYVTCHGVFDEKDVFATREDLAKSIIGV